jgi:hypothetical protein
VGNLLSPESESFWNGARQVLALHAAGQGNLEEAERLMLQNPQMDLPVVHLFGPGFCIRELHIPAGTFLIGHAHKKPLANMLVKGLIRVCSENRWATLEAPFFFVGSPGRKAAVALTDTIWQNILVTDETDPAKIEELFVDHSEQWTAARQGETK